VGSRGAGRSARRRPEATQRVGPRRLGAPAWIVAALRSPSSQSWPSETQSHTSFAAPPACVHAGHRRLSRGLGARHPPVLDRNPHFSLQPRATRCVASVQCCSGIRLLIYNENGNRQRIRGKVSAIRVWVPWRPVYGKANGPHWFLFSGAIQVGFQEGRKPALARMVQVGFQEGRKPERCRLASK
jgi:hypothetical protein